MYLNFGKEVAMYAIDKVKGDLIKICHRPVKYHKYEITMIKRVSLTNKKMFFHSET